MLGQGTAELSSGHADCSGHVSRESRPLCGAARLCCSCFPDLIALCRAPRVYSTTSAESYPGHSPYVESEGKPRRASSREGSGDGQHFDSMGPCLPTAAPRPGLRSASTFQSAPPRGLRSPLLSSQRCRGLVCQRVRLRLGSGLG